MQALKTLFGGLNMTWPKVIIFSLICGVYCGVVNQIPVLADTSITDIAVTWEGWVVLALIIATNCKSPLESCLKCGVFFLISQPLVYLVEMPMLGAYPWHYLNMWAPMIAASFVAGFLAYFLRKQKWYGFVIMFCIVLLISVLGFAYAQVVAMGGFPRHLLTVLFDIAAPIVLAFALREATWERIVCAIAAVAIVCAGFAWGLLGSLDSYASEPLPQGTTWTGVSWNAGCVDDIQIEGDGDDQQISIHARSIGEGTIQVNDEKGETITFLVSVSSDGAIHVTKQ